MIFIRNVYNTNFFHFKRSYIINISLFKNQNITFKNYLVKTSYPFFYTFNDAKLFEFTVFEK